MVIFTAISRFLERRQLAKRAENLSAVEFGTFEDPFTLDFPDGDETCVNNGREITFRQLNQELAEYYARQRSMFAIKPAANLNAAILAPVR